MDTLLELARSRRSVRKYTDEEIDESTLAALFKVASLAPSSWGRHPVEFVVVKDKAVIRKLAACKKMGAMPVELCKVAVVVAVDRRDCDLWIEDGAVASAYLLLAAEEKGIGACWVQMRGREGLVRSAEEEIRELLGIPSNYGVLNVVALGHKGEKKEPRGTSNLSLRNVHNERFG